MCNFHSLAIHEPWPDVPSVHSLLSGRPQGVRVKGIGVSSQCKTGKKGTGKGKGKASGS